MPMNEMPLIMKHHPNPTAGRSSAASAGPMAREPVIVAVLSAIAFTMPDGSTSSVTTPRRAGLSTVAMIPSTAAITSSTGMFASPAKVMTARATACTAMAVCVMTVNLQRLRWSANAPNHAPNSSMGTNWAAIAAPSSTPSQRGGARRLTSSAVATVCIQEPTWDTQSPAKNSLALRCPSARNVGRSVRLRTVSRPDGVR